MKVKDLIAELEKLDKPEAEITLLGNTGNPEDEETDLYFDVVEVWNDGEDTITLFVGLKEETRKQIAEQEASLVSRKTELIEKIKAVALKIYGASEVSVDKKMMEKLSSYEAAGYGHYPICIAKNQYSFSTDPTLRGAPQGHVLNIREVRLSAGAEFIVVVCGDIMTMPGLPKIPAANSIDVDDQGKISGLF